MDSDVARTSKRKQRVPRTSANDEHGSNSRCKSEKRVKKSKNPFGKIDSSSRSSEPGPLAETIRQLEDELCSSRSTAAALGSSQDSLKEMSSVQAKLCMYTQDNHHMNQLDARSQGSPKDNQNTSGTAGDLLGTRHSVASPDFSFCRPAFLDIDLNKPPDCGFDEFHLPEPSNALDLSVDSACKIKENVSTIPLCRTEDSSPMRAVVDKGKALVDSSPVLMSTTSSYKNNHLQEQITWSGVELDSLWLGVKRHGKGNWETMLGDPNLHFLPGKTSKVLAERWEEEQVQFLYGVSVSQLKSGHLASRDMNNHQSTYERDLTGNSTISLGRTPPSHVSNAQKNNPLEIPVTSSSRLSPNSFWENCSRGKRNSAIWSMCSPDGELLWEHFPWFV